MSKPELSKVILNFMLKNNRPYAINDVLTNCGKEFGKAAVQKTLDALVEKEKLTAKVFGKITIYFPKQSSDLMKLEQDLRGDLQKLTQLQNQLKTKTKECHELEQQLRAMKQTRSLESLDDERNALYDGIREINERLRSQEAAAKEANLTPADVKKIEKRYEIVATAYRKRKRICTDMVDAILEGCPKTKKALIEDIGIETDEAFNFKLNVIR